MFEPIASPIAELCRPLLKPLAEHFPFEHCHSGGFQLSTLCLCRMGLNGNPDAGVVTHTGNMRPKGLMPLGRILQATFARGGHQLESCQTLSDPYPIEPTFEICCVRAAHHFPYRPHKLALLVLATPSRHVWHFLATQWIGAGCK